MNTLQRVRIALLTLALVPLGATAQRASHPVTTGIQLSLPDITGPVWIYIDHRLVEAYKPTDNCTRDWSTVASVPSGSFEVFDESGLIAGYDSIRKRYYFGNTATEQKRRCFFHTWQIAASPGSHTLDIFYPYWYHSYEFPFLISSTQVEVEGANLTPVSPDLPDSWQPDLAQVPLAVPAQVGDICHEPIKPLVARLKTAEQRYLGLSVVQALHAQPAPVRSGSHSVVKLALPPDLGGTREFDGTEIEAIATAIVHEMERSIPSYSARNIEVCSQKNPDFVSSYREAAALLQKIDDDIESFYALARQLNGQP